MDGCVKDLSDLINEIGEHYSPSLPRAAGENTRKTGFLYTKAYTVGAQSIAPAQRHSTYVIIRKRPKFRKKKFGKIKKEEFARRYF
jgi:hypothetical protein